MKHFVKNPPNWNNDELIEELKIFAEIYKERKKLGRLLFPSVFDSIKGDNVITIKKIKQQIKFLFLSFFLSFSCFSKYVIILFF